MFANRLASFNALQLPVILTPGDNEWTDCHRENNGSYDPLERLAFERRMFYSTDESRGARKIKVFRQSEDPRYALYRENAIWTEGNVVLATLTWSTRRAILPISTGSIPRSVWRATAALPAWWSRSRPIRRSRAAY